MRKIYTTLLLSFFVANLLYLIFSMLSAEIGILKKAPALHTTVEAIHNEPLLPVNGFCSLGFEDFDKGITKFLSCRGFSGATLAIIKDGQFLVKRGYGWSDKNRTKLTSPDDYFRIASVTKILTAIAIKKLIQNNVLTYQTGALDYLGQFKKLLDPSMKKITLFQLLYHQGGWDSDRSLDPLFSLGLVTDTLKKELAQLTPKDVLRYTIESIKLDFVPGTETKYSNVGYLILGRVVEKASNMSYLDFINNLISKPKKAYFEVGPSKLSHKNPLEISFYQSNDINLESDSISLKAADSTFGLITSAPNLCTILDSYWIDGDKRAAGEHRQFAKTGTLPGTMALARQRYSGATIVVFINSRDNNNPETDNTALRQIIDNTANKCGI